MKSIEDICMELGNIPYMKIHQAKTIKSLIMGNNFRNAIELGFYHGKSSILIASIFEEIGEGHLTTFDLESARKRQPNILKLLGDYNLSHRVTPVFCERSYTWELAKIIRETNEPIYDFCYLDGGHTWDLTGFGFFLIDMLLKPGGIIIFDDMNWTISNSPSYQNALMEGKDPFAQYSKEEKNTPAVRMVLQELVSARGYICKEVKELQWGIAEKKKAPRPCPDEISSDKTAITTYSIDEIKDKNMIQQRGVDVFSDLRKYLPTFNPKTIFDVGANVGQSSLLYSKEFPDSQLYCFEPVSKTFEQLQHNTKLIPGCHCFNVGFSSKEGITEMVSNIEHSTRSRIKQKDDQCEDDSTVECVEARLDTLDRFCEQHNIEKIDLLKIDAEGHDLEVLKGGSSLLRDGKVELIMVEAGMNEDNKLHVPFNQLYEYLQNLGYYLFAFYEQKEDWINKMPHLRRSNPVFIRHMRKNSHDEKNDLKNALEGKNWGNKYDLYKDVFEGVSYRHTVTRPAISIIVISWRQHPDNLRNFQVLEKQRDQNFELIFVNNGGGAGEFSSLMPFVDTYVHLNTNTGAYLARNVGAVFAKAPILLFLEDDGIPEENFVQAHREIHRKYDVVAVRGVYSPKTDTPLNKLAAHYFLGDLPFPYPSNLEGNCTYQADIFYAVGGWDDDIVFGYGGRELSLRILDVEPDHRKQIYSPDPIIYHDFAANKKHLSEKRRKQESSLERLKQKYPTWDAFTNSWQRFERRYDLLIVKDLPYDIREIERLMTEGKHLEAVACLNDALSGSPHDASVYNTMGAVYLRIGRKELALENFSKAVKLEPQNLTFQKNLAAVFFDQQKFKEALEIYRSILQTYPKDTDSLMAIAGFCSIVGRHDKARQFWEAVLRVDSENSVALKRLHEDYKVPSEYSVSMPPHSVSKSDQAVLDKSRLSDSLRSYEEGSIDESEGFLSEYINQMKEARI